MISRFPLALGVWVLAALAASPAASQKADPLRLRDGYRMVIHGRGGTELSWEQFQDYTGPIRWELVGSAEVSDNAREMLRRGRQAVSQGQYDAAIELFSDAGQNSPDWEYPVYETAWAYLMAGDFSDAESYFNRLNEMVPHGFFNSQQAADCLRREREGEVPHGTYRRMMGLERGSHDTALFVLRDLLDRYPGYALGWERLSQFREDPKGILDAIQRGMKAQPDPFTRDQMRLRKALLADIQGNTKKAIASLDALVKDPDLSMPIEAQIKIARVQLARKLKTANEGPKSDKDSSGGR
jgi:tetratricopeptide (TPR) repeat protein